MKFCMIFMIYIAFNCFMLIYSEKIDKNKHDFESSSILVTGAAGFIGSHLVRHLYTTGFKNVIGLDTFNAYYSPALKRERAHNLLVNHGVTVVDGDVCDADMLRLLFEKYKFTHIVHLAAQAGVRYSLIQPLTYIHTNLKCFTILLEQIRSVGEKQGRDKMPHLLYASSSSVYGLNEKIPFSEIDPVEKPSNLYGATKRSNELMAYSYYHLFGIQSVGFRFFTVYGPWGRPDMAAYIFTEQISRGESITVYNNGNMKRDFTYVDDIVAGITASLDYKHKKPMVFNLGNNKPVGALYFLQLIEKSLGIKAKVKFEDSLAEIAITYANTTLASEELGFAAKTSIEEGIEKFITWYKEHESKQVLCESGCAVGNMCTTSAWEKPALESRKLTEGCETVVYTTVAHESLLNKITVKDTIKSECYVAFANTSTRKTTTTSASSLRNENKDSIEVQWNSVYVDMTKEKDVRNLLRVVKLSPKQFFASSVKYAIYIDHKLKLVIKPTSLVQLMNMEYVPDPNNYISSSKTSLFTDEIKLKSSLFSSTSKEKTLQSIPINNILMVIQQPRHFDIKEEARTQLAIQQIKAYEDYQDRLNFKINNLFDTSLLVHKLVEEDSQKFRCQWYREAQDWPDRESTSGLKNKETKYPILHSISGTWIPVINPLKNNKNSNNTITTNNNAANIELKYVRILPAKKYHWHYSQEIANNH